MSPLCRRVAVAARPPALALVSRRTFLATPQSSFPPAKSPLAAGEGVAVQKAAGKAKRAALGRAPGDPTEGRKKQTGQRIYIPKELRPPKAAPNPFCLFIQSLHKSQPKVNTVRECQEVAKRAGELWRGYSAAEKQPFYDEFEARNAQAKEAMEEFLRNTSSSDLKRLNAIRKAKGKSAFRRIEGPGGVASPFVFFCNEFRASPDGQALIKEASPEKKYVARAAVVAADRWRSMSEEEKAPYFERSRKAWEEFKAARADS